MIHLITDLPIMHHEMFYFSQKQELIHAHARFLCLLNGSLSVELPGAHYRMRGGDLLFLPEGTAYRLNIHAPALILYVGLHPYFMHNALGHLRGWIRPFYSDVLPEQKAALNIRIAGLITQCLNQDAGPNCNVYAQAYELLDYLARRCISPQARAQSQRCSAAQTDAQSQRCSAAQTDAQSQRCSAAQADALSLHSSAAQTDSQSLHSSAAQTDALSKLPDKAAAKLTQLEQFLGSHYMEALSLNDAADALGYTPPYLSSFVKKYLGQTFQEYLNGFRLDSAMLLLSYTGEPLQKIALMCGFPNLNSLLNSFQRAQGISAEEFRARQRLAIEGYPDPSGIRIANRSLILDYIFNYMNYTAASNALYTAAASEQAEVVSDPGHPVKPLWRFLINLGSAKDYEKPSFRNHLMRIQSALHFSYGRCTELLPLMKSYDIGERKIYDFSHVFRLIDFMRGIGLKPFFDIDAKPFLLYKAPEEHIDYREYLSTERYDSFLFEILPEFVKACITRYGFDEFYTWKFELWRRYNMNMSSLESPEDFCARFQQVAGIFKELAPEACLGGPGFNGFLPSFRFRELLAAFVDAPYQPDFISAYYMPYMNASGESFENPSGYTASPSVLAMDQKLREWNGVLEHLGFGDKPLYITEYSAHISMENYLNDSTYPATYIFHQTLRNQDLMDGLGYWLATDLSLEYGNPNAPLFGGNGLLSKDGIPKPSFYAHEFLNCLGDRALKWGEHYIVTVTPQQELRILFYHCGTLKQSFAEAPLNRELLHYPYSAFEDATPLRLSLTLADIAPGSYRIREYSLNLNHGNVLHAWGQLNHLVNITRDETRYMDSKSVPLLRLRMEKIQGAYVLSATLNINEALLYCLDPQR